MDASLSMEGLRLVLEFLDQHFFGLVLLVVIVTFRKGIAGFVERVTKLTFNAPGGYSGGVEAAPPVPVLRDAPPVALPKSARPDESTPEQIEVKEELKNKKAEEGPSVWQAHLAILEGDIERAERVFEAVQKAEADPDERYSNEAFFLYLLYAKGGRRDALRRLESLQGSSANDRQLDASTTWLSYSYATAKDYDKEEKLWRSAISQVSDEKIKTSFIAGLAQFCRRNGAIEQGIDLLERRLLQVDDKEQRASIYSTLASLDKEAGRGEDSAIALEKSTELAPGDQDKLFEAAYQQSEQSLALLSIANYETLLALDQHHATALNNLGVCAGEFKLPGKKIELYKRAITGGSTLAMANLANEHIDAGLWDEAQEVIDTARKTEDPHENVGSALYRLQASRASEEKKWAALNKKAVEFQRRVRAYGDALFRRPSQDIECSGTWYTAGGEEVTVRTDGKKVSGEWAEIKKGALSSSTNKYSFSGTTRNHAARVIYRKREADERPHGLLGGPVDETVKCFSCFSVDQQEWSFFSTDVHTDLAFAFTRERPGPSSVKPPPKTDRAGAPAPRA